MSPAGAGIPIVGGAVDKITDPCREEPHPDDPRGGVGDVLAPKPPGPSQDPFTNPDVSMYQRYGYGGMVYQVYDLGCLGTASAGPLNNVANLELRGMVYLHSLGSFLHRVGQTRSWWDALDPVVTSSQTLAQQLLWANNGVLTIALLVLACILIWLGLRHQMSVILTLGVTAFVVLLLGHVAAFNGLDSVHFLRDSVVGFTSAFETPDQAAVDSDVVHRELLYRTWAAGMFGDADSPVAKEYGPRLFDCLTYRWDDPQTSEKEAEKQDCVHKTMDELKEKHPVESQYAHGAKTTEQFGTATLGLVGTFAATMWSIWAGLAGLILNLMVTFVVPAIMFVIPLALFKNGTKIFLRPMFDLVVGAAIRVIVCSLTGQVVGWGTGVVLAAGSIPWLVRVILLILVIVVSVALTKHHRKLAGGHAEKHVYATARKAVAAGATAAAMAAGIPPVIVDTMPEPPKQKSKTAVTDSTQPEGWVAPALPAAGQTTPAGQPPVSWQHEPTGTVPAGLLGAAHRDSGHQLPAGSGAYRDASGVWVDSNRGVEPAGALTAAPPRPALPAASSTVISEDEVRASLRASVASRIALDKDPVQLELDRMVTDPGWIAPRPGEAQ